MKQFIKITLIVIALILIFNARCAYNTHDHVFTTIYATLAGLLIIIAIFGVHDSPDAPDVTLVELPEDWRIKTIRFRIPS